MTTLRERKERDKFIIKKKKKIKERNYSMGKSGKRKKERKMINFMKITPKPQINTAKKENIQ